jgi:hypothetical protein
VEYNRGDQNILSDQKPRKKSGPQRRIDLNKVFGKAIPVKSQSRQSRYRLIRGPLFILIAAAIFFTMGYLIAAVSISLWIKILIFIFISVIGFALSYIVANLLY